MLSVSCVSVLSVLSVTFMHCGQTVGRINTKLGTRVGLGPGHIVLDGDPPTLPQRGTVPLIFGPYLLRPNGCVDKDVTWYGARPRPRRLCVIDGDPVPLPQKGGGAPQFSAHVYCGQTAGWIKMPLGTKIGRSPDDFVLDGDPASLPKKGRSPPNFRASSIVVKWLMIQDATWYRGRPWPTRHCVRCGPSSSSPNGHSLPIFG